MSTGALNDVTLKENFKALLARPVVSFHILNFSANFPSADSSVPEPSRTLLGGFCVLAYLVSLFFTQTSISKLLLTQTSCNHNQTYCMSSMWSVVVVRFASEAVFLRAAFLCNPLMSLLL